MEFFGSLADEYIEKYNMYEKPRDWALTTSWLILAVTFLVGSGVFGIVMMWQTYGAASLILDLLIGIPAVAVFTCVGISYGVMLHKLAKVLKDEEENDDYYD